MAYIALAAFLIGLFKGLSDSVQHSDTWMRTVLSHHFRIGSFMGAADVTWKRKYKQGDSKLIAYLRKTLLVMFSDLWHLSEALRDVSTAGIILVAMYIDVEFWHIGVYAAANQIGFYTTYLGLRIKK